MNHHISLRLKDFAAAHRLVKGYKKACHNLHGHNYGIEVTLSASSLNHFGFVLDFSDVKTLFNTWVQANWDHATLVCEEDQPLLNFLKENNQPYFIMPNGYNTTAERLAECLYKQFEKILAVQSEIPSDQIKLAEVRLSETKNSTAIYGVSSTSKVSFH